MRKILDALQSSNRRAIALSLLRIFVAVHLLKKLIFEWSHIDMMYGTTSLISHLPFRIGNYTFDSGILREHIHLLLSLYIVVILLFFFGIGKTITNIVLLLFLATFQRLDWFILNGGDNLLFFLIFYLIFADSYQYFSISKFKIRKEENRKLVNLLSNLAAWSIMLQFCLIYIVSALHKTHADVWFNGVAVYYTFQLERFKGTPFNDAIAKNALFTTFATYFTIFFEMYFPVLVFNRKLKPYLVLSGIILHLGIYIFMMIYDFQWVFIITYVAYFTDEEILAFKKKRIDPLLAKFRRSQHIPAPAFRN
jgi:hypothetical protein